MPEDVYKTEIPRVLSPEEQLESAQEASDWLVPYLFGVEVEPGAVSMLAKARLSDILGAQATAVQLNQLKELFAGLPSEHKNNAILYCAGYPQAALSALGEGDVDVTLQLLLDAGAPYRPAVEPRRAVHAEAFIDDFRHVSVPTLPVAIQPVSPPTKQIPVEPTVPTIRVRTITNGLGIDPSRVIPWPSGKGFGHVLVLKGSPLDKALSDDVEEDDGPLAWQADALCAQTDPEAFFPEKGGSTRDAKKICAMCEVSMKCLQYATDNGERFGIWGGLSERERRKLRKKAL